MARQNSTGFEARREEPTTPEHVCTFFFQLLTFGRKFLFLPCSPSVVLIRLNEGPEWAQWPPTHTSTAGQSRGSMANDRVLVWGKLTTSAGLSEPLLTDHTGECLPRAHDFQFFHWKNHLGRGGQEAKDNCLFSVNNILFTPQSSYPLALLLLLLPAHSFTHQSI